jgi:hypothetical protein
LSTAEDEGVGVVVEVIENFSFVPSAVVSSPVVFDPSEEVIVVHKVTPFIEVEFVTSPV